MPTLASVLVVCVSLVGACNNSDSKNRDDSPRSGAAPTGDQAMPSGKRVVAKRTYSQSDSALVREACEMRDLLSPHPTKENDPRLAAFDSRLDFGAYDAQLRRVFSEVPKGGSCSHFPIELGTLDAETEIALVPVLNDISSSLTLLKEVGGRYYRARPAQHWLTVAASLPLYATADEVDVEKPETFTALAMQDRFHQVPEAQDDLPLISRFSNLAVLFLFGNDMTTFPIDCEPLAKLKVLELSQNAFTSIPEAILACKSLESLDLSSNQLRSLPSDLAERLPNLRYLDVSGNSIPKKQVERAREQMKDCFIDFERVVYTQEESLMNYIRITPDWVFLADGVLTEVPARLPRQASGVHVVAAKATVGGERRDVVAQVNAATGSTKVFVRGAQNRWTDVTEQATNIALAANLAP